MAEQQGLFDRPLFQAAAHVVLQAPGLAAVLIRERMAGFVAVISDSQRFVHFYLLVGVLIVGFTIKTLAVHQVLP